jgi:hypothetical protein
MTRRYVSAKQTIDAVAALSGTRKVGRHFIIWKISVDPQNDQEPIKFVVHVERADLEVALEMCPSDVIKEVGDVVFGIEQWIKGEYSWLPDRDEDQEEVVAAPPPMVPPQAPPTDDGPAF